MFRSTHFPVANRRRVVRLAGLAVAVLLLAGCASSGPVDNPVARNLTWFSYVAADDIRTACEAGGADSYRLIYNANFTEQVRSYDIRALPMDGGAVMTVRVKTPVRLGALRLTAPFTPWQATPFHRRLSSEEFGILVDMMAASGAFGPAPAGLRLHSSAFYWVVAACRGGHFSFNAFLYPSRRFERIAFDDPLSRLDPSGIPFNPPIAGAGALRLPEQCGSRRDPPPECLYPPFVFEVEEDGLKGSALL